MHGLNTIVRHNDAAVLAASQTKQPHLAAAPIDERFDYNIPWRFEGTVLHVHLHADTKAVDLMKLKRLVAAEKGPTFQVKEHQYQ